LRPQCHEVRPRGCLLCVFRFEKNGSARVDENADGPLMETSSAKASAGRLSEKHLCDAIQLGCDDDVNVDDVRNAPVHRSCGAGWHLDSVSPFEMNDVGKNDESDVGPPMGTSTAGYDYHLTYESLRYRVCVENVGKIVLFRQDWGTQDFES